jgi:hypothetical protein
VLTFDFGGAAFGLQAFLTTFSKEDICESQPCLTVSLADNSMPHPTYLPFMEFLFLSRGDNECHPPVLTYCALYIVLNREQRCLLKEG